MDVNGTAIAIVDVAVAAAFATFAVVIAEKVVDIDQSSKLDLRASSQLVLVVPLLLLLFLFSLRYQDFLY